MSLIVLNSFAIFIYLASVTMATFTQNIQCLLRFTPSCVHVWNIKKTGDYTLPNPYMNHLSLHRINDNSIDVIHCYEHCISIQEWIIFPTLGEFSTTKEDLFAQWAMRYKYFHVERSARKKHCDHKPR